MSLISRWFSTTLSFGTDDQNTPEVDLIDSFEAIEIDIPTLSVAAEIQIKGSNLSGGTFDLIAQEEPIASSTGGFRTTVPLGGKYRYIKVYTSVAQTGDATFAVRGISYASGGLVALIDRIKAIETAVSAISSPPTEVSIAIQNGVGIAYTGPGRLYWMLVCNRYMSEGSCTIADGSAWSFPIWSKSEVSFMLVCNPPIQFSTNIRCSAVSNYGFELVFGYVAGA